MKCPVCDQLIPDDSSFCPGCGANLQNFHDLKFKDLVCKSCGGDMEVDYAHQTLVCPYCGAKEVLIKDGEIHQKSEPEKNTVRSRPSRKPGKGLLKAALIIGVSLVFIVTVAAVIGMTSHHVDKHAAYEWPESGLAAMIPDPGSAYGKIYSDYYDHFSMDAYQYTADEYRSYVQQCEQLGFTVDEKKEDTSFDAYNEEGYRLKVYFYSYEDEMYISLESPVEMSTIDWASIDAFQGLPAPQSDQGKVEWEYSDSAMVYVGNTSKEDFHAYMNACKAAGFNRDLMKSDDYFSAYEQDSSRYLTISYEGFQTMRIDVSEYEEE